LQKMSPEELTGVRTTGLRRNLLGHAILAGQIALSVVLISAAALLLRSFWKIETVALGMRPANVFTVPLTIAEHQYPQPANRVQFFEEVERRTGRLPGVEASAVSDSIPPTGSMRTMIYSLIDVEGRARAAQGTGGMVGWRAVTPGFFETLGIPIRRGRGFTAQDRDPGAAVTILGEALVRRLFPNQDPLGQHVRFGGAGPWYTVVGVVGTVKNAGLSAPEDPEYYLPRKHGQDPGRRAVLSIRSRMKPDAMSAWIRTEIAGIDPALPVTVEPMEERVSRLAARPRFNAVLLSVFAGAGLLLAAIGLYGVMAFLVAQRTQEIGVRMALGATRAEIVRLVLSHAARWTLAGCILGLLGSLSLTRVLRTLLFEAPPQDIAALAWACALLVAVVFAAAWVPSRRAAGVDPMQALRHE
jgi:putative ABC transport system permease protein